MLSNHTPQYLVERIAYYVAQLQKYPQWKDCINTDIVRHEAMLEEANDRNIIGYDATDNAKVFLHEQVVCVEGKPSGWSVERFNLKQQNPVSVCYDGGSKWYGSLIFTSTK